MRGKMIVIQPSGEKVITDLAETPNLDQLQSGVGGFIEVIPYFSKYEGHACVAFCNEEGRLKGMLRNSLAHELWEASNGLNIDYMLVGPVVIVIGDNELLERL
jgi:Domain of unknown function (DUF3846)